MFAQRVEIILKENTDIYSHAFLYLRVISLTILNYLVYPVKNKNDPLKKISPHCESFYAARYFTKLSDN